MCACSNKNGALRLSLSLLFRDIDRPKGFCEWWKRDPSLMWIASCFFLLSFVVKIRYARRNVDAVASALVAFASLWLRFGEVGRRCFVLSCLFTPTLDNCASDVRVGLFVVCAHSRSARVNVWANNMPHCGDAF